MTDEEIEELVSEVACDSSLDSEAAWARLRPVRDRVLPFVHRQYHKTPRWRARLNLLFHCIGLSRTNKDGVPLGIAALSDRSRRVRYRACMLLAIAQDEDAIPHLEALLQHPDAETVDDAKSAIRSIKKKNHNHFYDRDGTGQMRLTVGDFTPPAVKKGFF